MNNGNNERVIRMKCCCGAEFEWPSEILTYCKSEKRTLANTVPIDRADAWIELHRNCVANMPPGPQRYAPEEVLNFTATSQAPEKITQELFDATGTITQNLLRTNGHGEIQRFMGVRGQIKSGWTFDIEVPLTDCSPFGSHELGDEVHISITAKCPSPA